MLVLCTSCQQTQMLQAHWLKYRTSQSLVKHVMDPLILVFLIDTDCYLMP